MKTAIITGITGQDGSYLSSFLLAKGYKVIGLVRPVEKVSLRNLKYLGIENKITLIGTNLLNLHDIIEVLERTEVDEIYNLAAQSSVGESFKQPLETIEFNIISVAKLLEAIRHINIKIKFYQASSSEMFGNVKEDELPINEHCSLNPVSPYGISKETAHRMVKHYKGSYGLFAVCGICFNHESVLRKENFVTKKIINTAVKISMGLAKELKVGNIEIYRDWGYAPKYVEAMWLMLQQNQPKDYIICSGQAHSLAELIEKVFERLDLDFKRYVRIDKSLYRPVDINMNYGSSFKAKEELGWNYDKSFEQLIYNLVDQEVEYIKREPYFL
jgi:GDPmannose 4,6-dehydratase